MDVSTFLIKDPVYLFSGLRRYPKLSPDNVYIDRQFQRRIFEVAAEYSVTSAVKASVSFYDRVPSKPIHRTRFYTPFDMTPMVSHRLNDLSNSLLHPFRYDSNGFAQAERSLELAVSQTDLGNFRS